MKEFGRTILLLIFIHSQCVRPFFCSHVLVAATPSSEQRKLLKACIFSLLYHLWPVFKANGTMWSAVIAFARRVVVKATL